MKAENSEARGQQTVPDLSACAREPIHVPGSIQPHAALLAIDPLDGQLRYASGNLAEWLGVQPRWDAAWLEWRPGNASSWAPIDALRPETGDTVTSVVPLPGRALRALSHWSGNWQVIELEAEPAASVSADMGSALERLATFKALQPLIDAAVEEVKRLAGFDRVMVYRFDDDGHGEVLAESREPEMEPYLGLHYPESDIPRQARELYRRQWIRAIPDARYLPVPLHAAPTVEEPLDLSLAHSRSVSPVHLEYMANMGLGASMSVSLLVGGRLWGLVSCGHRTTRAIPYPLRRACETLGRVLSVQIEALETLALQERLRAQSLNLQRLVEAMRRGQSHVLQGLLDEPASALEVFHASGCAVVLGDCVCCLGHCPPEDDLKALSELVLTRADEGGQFATRQLGLDEPAFASSSPVASGVLSFRMPEPARDVVFWFRPELVHTVHWGGNPNKSAEVVLEKGVPRLHPRRSFALWQEQVRGRSLPWQAAERQLVAELRRHAVELDLARQMQKERAAVKARDDLMAVVSHDLRTPLSVISMQAALIQRMMEEERDEPSQRMVTSAQIIQRSADRMKALLQDLLDLAKIEAGRFRIVAQPQPLAHLLQDAYELLQPVAHGAQVTLTLAPVPEGVVVHVDSERIFQVLANLIGNAIKFTPAGGQVRLAASVEASRAVVRVSDTGPGIPAEQLPRIFDRYWQARSSETLGAGLGLYIAKGIVEQHGGTLEAASPPGSGAVLTFTLPLRP